MKFFRTVKGAENWIDIKLKIKNQLNLLPITDKQFRTHWTNTLNRNE